MIVKELIVIIIIIIKEKISKLVLVVRIIVKY